MGKPSTPSAPDPNVVADATTRSNIATGTANTELNRVNQSTPYGSSTYSIVGYNPDGTPQYTQQTSLSPASQQLLDTQQQGAQALGQTGLGLLGQINQNYGAGFNPTQPGQAQTQAQNAAYASNTQYLDPQFQQGYQQLDTQLRNEGATPGTEAYNNAIANFDRARQAAYSDARNQSFLTGNQAENQYFNQALTNYQLPLNSYTALMQNTQYQNPSFQNVPGATVAPTDVAGINQNSFTDQMANYNAQNQATNNLVSGAGSLGSLGLLGYLALSDRRLKHDIKRVWQTSGGIPLYEFRYNADPGTKHTGVMADEVAHIPGAVVIGPGGYSYVDYSRIEP